MTIKTESRLSRTKTNSNTVHNRLELFGPSVNRSTKPRKNNFKNYLPKKLQHFVQHFDAVRNVRASGGEALHALHFGLHEHGLVLITARHKVRGSITVPAGRAMRPRRYFRLRQLLTALQCTDLYTKILQPNCCNNESSETAFAAAIVTSLQWCDLSAGMASVPLGGKLCLLVSKASHGPGRAGPGVNANSRRGSERVSREF